MMQSGILRQTEFNADLKIQSLEEKIKSLEERIINLEKLNIEKSINIVKSINDKKLSIIIENYKKSIIIKNKFSDKFTTQSYKDKLKEIGGKWTKNDKITGWIFLGLYDEKKSLEECSESIITKIKEECLDLEYEYNKI